jgi:hypothetical protein
MHCVWGEFRTAGQVIDIRHPDAVREVLGVLECHGGNAGPRPFETMARVLAAAEAWRERYEAEERAHARRRDDPLRLHEVQVIHDLVEARRRAQKHSEAKR